jgi:hypothetical protein
MPREHLLQEFVAFTFSVLTSVPVRLQTSSSGPALVQGTGGWKLLWSMHRIGLKFYDDAHTG